MNGFKFIYADEKYCTRDAHVNAPIFRKCFPCYDAKSVKLTVAVVGFYRLFLNGEELTKGYFAPYIANPDDLVYYDEYDVTKKIKKNNVLCVLLGNGFSNCMDGDCWQFESASFRSAPRLAFTVYADGQLVAESDGAVEVYPSAITYDDLRAGERYDARLENFEILTATDVITNTHARIAPPPKGELRRSGAHSVKVFERILPVQIHETEEGYVYDFGQVNAGIYKLRIKAVAGQRIDLYFGEVFSRGKFEIGSVMNAVTPEDYAQHDVYICKDGYQEYTPSFTYHGYRYVLVRGIEKRQAEKGLLEYLVLHSDVKTRGYFRCSDETLNRIQECVIRSDLGNLVCIPTDCPQREKNGWTADVALSAEQFLYNFDCGSDLREWLISVCKAQAENGALPGIVPTAGWGFEWGNGPAWDSVLIELPYRLYRFYGDRTVVSDCMEPIMRYFSYLKTRLNESGLLAIGLGDWCETGTFGEGDYATPLEVTDSLITVILLKKALSLLKVVPDPVKERMLFAMQSDLINAFRAKWVQCGRVICNTQTAQALALHAGIFEEDEIAAQKALAEMVKSEKGHFKVGVIGVRYLFEELSRAGYTDLAYRSIVHEGFPSYAYWLSRGATTLWEAFNRLKDEEGVFERADGGRMLSLNHHFWGSVSGWFYKTLGGLNIVACDRVEIDPDYHCPLQHCACSFENERGKIAVRWERCGGKISLRVKNEGFCGTVSVSGEKRVLTEGVSVFEIDV